MCARFTVLSDTPMPCAIAGCVIPLSRHSTIWMRSRCAGGTFFQCSAVFSRRTSALVHLIICPPNQMRPANHTGQEKNTAPTTLTRSVHKNLDSSGFGGGIRIVLKRFVRADKLSPLRVGIVARHGSFRSILPFLGVRIVL